MHPFDPKLPDQLRCPLFLPCCRIECHADREQGSGIYLSPVLRDVAARGLQACELQTLLMGGDPRRVNPAPNWRELPPGGYATAASSGAGRPAPASCCA